MSLLRIITGFRGEGHGDEVPDVLYVGYDADAARKAAADAPSEFCRIELIESRRGHRVRKSQPGAAGNAPLSTQAEPAAAMESLPQDAGVAHAPASPAEVEEEPALEDSDGPTLGAPAKKAKR